MDSKEVNLQVKRLQAMLDATTMMDPTLNLGGGGGEVRTLTIARARVGTRLVV
jgi:hypothetical protein